MNYPDHNTIIGQPSWVNRGEMITMLNNYESAIKPQIDALESELDKYKKIFQIHLSKIDRINIENCDLKLQNEHLLRVSKKKDQQLSFRTDQWKGEQSENAKLKKRVEELKGALRPFALRWEEMYGIAKNRALSTDILMEFLKKASEAMKGVK